MDFLTRLTRPPVVTEPPKRTVGSDLMDRYLSGELDTVSYLIELADIPDPDAPPQTATEIMIRSERPVRERVHQPSTREDRYDHWHKVQQLHQHHIIESDAALRLLQEHEALIERQAQFRAHNPRAAQRTVEKYFADLSPLKED